MAGTAARPECVPLQGRGGRRILFELHGVEHPVHPTGPGRAFARYEDFTHVAVSERGLWLATRRDSLLIPRSAFEDDSAPESVADELIRRIGALPAGRAQLDRIAAVEARGGRVHPLRATYGLVAICGMVFLLQLLLGQDVLQVGFYSRAFAEFGDRWRLITANFLHAAPAFPVHLALNMLGVVFIGGICERALGTLRTITVMGAAGLLAMRFCGWFETGMVVGASGILAGLLGSLTFLEFFRTDDMPAWWRLPRRPLLAMLGATVLIDWIVPALAGPAHIGGFLGGMGATWLAAGRPVGEPPSVPWIRASSALLLVVSAVGLGTAVVEFATTRDYAARNLIVLAELPDVDADLLNNMAWEVAIDEESTHDHLVAARSAAERAVDLTEGREPTILDTLAEVHFVLGEADLALFAIDQAIALAPWEEYYREQRRRFLGERDADDRPSPPLRIPVWQLIWETPVPVPPPPPPAPGEQGTIQL